MQASIQTKLLTLCILLVLLVTIEEIGRSMKEVTEQFSDISLFKIS